MAAFNIWDAEGKGQSRKGPCDAPVALGHALSCITLVIDAAIHRSYLFFKGQISKSIQQKRANRSKAIHSTNQRPPCDDKDELYKSECFACLISVISLIGIYYLRWDVYISMGKSEGLSKSTGRQKPQQRIELET